MLPTRFHVSRGTQDKMRRVIDFEYEAFTFFGVAFQPLLLSITLVTPDIKISIFLQPQFTNIIGLGCSRFARHYYGNHYLFSFPPGTKMFQFSGFTSKYHETQTLPHYWQWVAPFGHFRIVAYFPAPRNLSQDITSFFVY